MVYLKANDPLLCRVLDALDKPSAPPPTPDARAAAPSAEGTLAGKEGVADDADGTGAVQSSCAASARAFIERSLHNLVQTVAPLALQDALWVFLFLRRDHLIRLSRAEAARVGQGQSDEKGSGAGAEGEAPADSEPPLSLMAALARRGLAFSTLVVASVTQPAVAPARRERESGLDALLRRRSEPSALPPGPRSGGGAFASQIAVVELALAAYSNPRRLQTLCGEPTLGLLVRDLEGLWALLYICRAMKLRARRQAELLTGARRAPRRRAPAEEKKRGGAAHGTPAAASSSLAEDADELPADECFHDYALLLPVHTVNRIVQDSGRAASLHAPASLAAAPWRTVMALCAAPNASAAREQQTQCWWQSVEDCARAEKADECEEEEEGNHKEGAALAEPNRAAAGPGPGAALPGRRLPVLTPSTAAHAQASAAAATAQGNLFHALLGRSTTRASVSVVLCPAVSAAVDNPSRRLKNHRVDLIEQAAMRHLYRQLTQAGRGGCGPDGAGGEGVLSDLHTHLPGAAADVTVIDPSQFTRNRLYGTNGEAAEDGDRALGGLAADAIVPAHRRLKSLRQIASEQASLARFLQESSIGLDIQLMALSGAAIGYYMGVLRGASKETCWTYAMIGLVTLMLVDAVLLIIRVGKEDEATLKTKKKIGKERAKLSKATATPDTHASVSLPQQQQQQQPQDASAERESAPRAAAGASDEENREKKMQ